jgi:hypothetical protein
MPETVPEAKPPRPSASSHSSCVNSTRSRNGVIFAFLSLAVYPGRHSKDIKGDEACSLARHYLSPKYERSVRKRTLRDYTLVGSIHISPL